VTARPPAAAIPAVLRAEGISKRFGGVIALREVSFDLRRGEVHALLGENGAGKSTLMKILAGMVRPDAGGIVLDGRPVSLASPLAARQAGVMLVHQELSLVPQVSVAENIFLGALPMRWPGRLDRAALGARAQAILTRLDCDFGPWTIVERLSIAKRQMVEIARALVATPKVVMFDEPTASLTDHEKMVLFRVIRDLRGADVGIVYISHRMDEIFEIADRISVLRDGTYRGTHETAATDEDEVTRLMIGRTLDRQHHARRPPGAEVVLETRGLTCAGVFENVDLVVRKGEIVGMYGLVGAGRSEVAETLFGLRRPTRGEIMLDGRRFARLTPPEAIAQGIALVPEDRKEQGLILGLSCRDNLTLPLLDRMAAAGVLRPARERAVFDRYVQALAIRASGWRQPVQNLSGGNQQKIVIGKWLATQPRLLILDEPTRGIDVGSKAEIHRLIRGLADEGYAVLVISSEMPEVMSLSDRIVAMYAGRITGTFDARNLTEDRLVQAVTGVRDPAGVT